MRARARIEAGFARWGRLVVRARWAAIAACLGLTAVFASALPSLRVDNSSEAFLSADDPARVRYERFKDAFSREDRVSVILRPGRIFEPAFLETLRDLHEAIEAEVPYVEEVTSLVNARHTRGEGDRLVVEDLLEDWPETPEEIETIRQRVHANPLYLDALITEDEAYTIVSVEPFTYSTLDEVDVLAGFEEGAGQGRRPRELTDVEAFELVRRLEEVVARYASPELEIHLVGGPTFDRRMTLLMQRDVTVFMSLSFGVIFVVLFVVFRRVSGVVLPMVIVFSALVSAIGFMAWRDIPYSVTLNMLPAFLLVVGLCDAIHLLTIVYQRLAAGTSREDAIADALGHSGLAVAMTSITTAAGLASFTVAELAPIRHLGVVASVGVLLAMLYTFTLLPALLAVSPLRSADAVRGATLRASLDRGLARVGELSTRRPWRTLAVAGLVLAVALPGLFELRFQHDGRLWFPEDDPFRVALELVDREFKGTTGLEVLAHTGEENGLYDPGILRRIERFTEHASGLRVDGKPLGNVTSLVDVVKETNRALHANRQAYYRLPDDRRLIAQELLLFENAGSDDLEEVTDSLFGTARISLRIPWVDSGAYSPLIAEIERSFREILGPGVGLEVTGGVALFNTVFEALLTTMARSYVLALLVITPLMVLLIGSLRRGLVSMVPNLLPIALVLSLMGWTGIPLDASTLLIGGVVIGLVVDDTIHFMHKFSRYYEASGDAREAVHRTLATTGAALLFTSIVLTGGFAVMLAAYMVNAYWFGLLAGFATVVAFAADILLAPALMVLVCEGGAPGRFESPSSSPGVASDVL